MSTPEHTVVLKKPMCVCVCLCILDSSAQDVSLSHQSDQLAESLQGWSYSITIRPLSIRPTLLNVYKMLRLCVFAIDSLQCGVYQRQSATPASIHSALS